MKNKYVKPEMTIDMFKVHEILTESNVEEGGGDGVFDDEQGSEGNENPVGE